MTTICWYCSEPVDTNRAVQCPRNYDVKTETYMCEGVFCSYECVVSYIRERIPCRIVANHAYENLIKMLTKANNGKFTAPRRSPHFSQLQRFGGTMTINEFRNHGGEPVIVVEPCSRMIKCGFAVHGIRSSLLDIRSDFERLVEPPLPPSLPPLPPLPPPLPPQQQQTASQKPLVPLPISKFIDRKTKRVRVSTYVPKPPAVNARRFKTQLEHDSLSSQYELQRKQTKTNGVRLFGLLNEKKTKSNT